MYNKMKEYKYKCCECLSDFVRNYIITKKPKNPKVTEPYKIYCSKECRVKSRDKERKYIECSNCGKDVRYMPSIHKEHKFCSNDCKGDWMSKNSDKLNLSQRASKMRESWGDNAWKKGIETRIKNGNIIDWNNAEWKQYWKRCDWLTRKIRKQMLEKWDGIDYIDGEYIRDNLDLHFSHKNYPTLDHIKSRSQCFREGLSPYESTCPDNLKWTKRINNSIKHNK